MGRIWNFLKGLIDPARGLASPHFQFSKAVPSKTYGQSAGVSGGTETAAGPPEVSSPESRKVAQGPEIGKGGTGLDGKMKSVYRVRAAKKSPEDATPVDRGFVAYTEIGRGLSKEDKKESARSFFGAFTPYLNRIYGSNRAGARNVVNEDGIVGLFNDVYGRLSADEQVEMLESLKGPLKSYKGIAIGTKKGYSETKKAFSAVAEKGKGSFKDREALKQASADSLKTGGVVGLPEGSYRSPGSTAKDGNYSKAKAEA